MSRYTGKRIQNRTKIQHNGSDGTVEGSVVRALTRLDLRVSLCVIVLMCGVASALAGAVVKAVDVEDSVAMSPEGAMPMMTSITISKSPVSTRFVSEFSPTSDESSSDAETATAEDESLVEESSLGEDEPTLEPITTTRLGVTVTDYDTTVDYTAAITQCYDMIDDQLSNVDHVLGLCEIYEAQRNLKILGENLGYETSTLFSAENSYEYIHGVMSDDPEIALMAEAEQEDPEPVNRAYYNYTEEDLILLARIVWAEAGGSWCYEENRRDVASVVMNRVTSSKWPNTVYDVIHQSGQYPTKNSTYYDETSLASALYVLENGPTTEGVYQANFKQGTTVLKEYHYSSGTVYICK